VTIPSVFYGKYADVKKNTGRLVTKMRKGFTIEDSLAELGVEMLIPGQFEIILDGPSPLNGARAAYHMFTLPRLLLERAGGSQDSLLAHRLKQPEYFLELNNTFWGHLSMSCRQHVYGYFSSEKIRVKYMLSIFSFRNEYGQCQKMFDDNNNFWLPVHNKTKDILDHPNHIAKYVLGNLDHVRAQTEEEELRVALSETSFDECIEKFKVEEYVNNCF